MNIEILLHDGKIKHIGMITLHEPEQVQTTAPCQMRRAAYTQSARTHEHQGEEAEAVESREKEVATNNL